MCAGVHVNGFVRREDGGLDIWVAKRAADKAQFPSKLDHLCAGGQPQGVSPKENVIKECKEEANVPRELAEQAVPTGAVSYSCWHEGSLKRDVIFTFDLELPRSFTPKNTDDEVQWFERRPVEEVARLVRDTNEYKPNCTLVIIDFLIRHGYIHPELPGYLSLLSSLRSGECS